uniref:Methyltransferase 22, Kin17 lysine n=1 Tax=Cynoglossus semilaevis TaxID=244447 RepID=A0A3P8VXL2_CYNSE
MDQFTFRYDTVLSDVHILLPNARHLMTRLNHVGQPGGYCHLSEHTMATPLEDVGKQVWRGAFLLADFILSEADMFRGATVLELGAGMGFTSIVMATVAKTVYCTGVMMNIPDYSEFSRGEVKVKQLDWLQYSLCTDADVDFSWTEEEVADLYDNTHFIIAADVIYDEDLTDGLFRILYRLCRNFTHTCTVLLSLEKRMNFSLRHMDVCCEAYSYFRRCLSQLLELQEPRCSFRVEQLPTANLAQFFLYERVEQLELWKLTVSPRQSDQVQSEPDLTRPDPTRPDLT